MAGELDLSNGAKVKTSGALTNDGSVNLSHTSETIGGAVSGTGNLSLSNSTLEFANGVSSGETVTFGSGVNHLHLDSPSSFLGTIEDFLTPGDSVSAKTFAEAATLLTYTQTGAEFLLVDTFGRRPHGGAQLRRRGLRADRLLDLGVSQREYSDQVRLTLSPAIGSAGESASLRGSVRFPACLGR